MKPSTYIYPAGVTGKVLGGMVEYVTGKKPIFIDDNIGTCGIRDYAKVILSQGASVELAWDKRSGLNHQTIFKLQDKLRELSIPYCEDSMLFYARESVKKLKSRITLKGWKQVLGIELGGMAEDKHLGFLDDKITEFSKGGIKIVYFCGTSEAYQRIQEKIFQESLDSLAIFLPCFYLDLVDCVDVLCKVSWTPKNTKISTIIVGHSLADFSSLSLKEQKEKLDYLCIASPRFMPSGGGGEFIPCGYLGFDRMVREISRQEARVKKAVLFAPYDIAELELMIPYMQAIQDLLPNVKVILRSRSFCENVWNSAYVKQMLKPLESAKNFFIDDSWQIQSQSYLDSFLFVCGKTTSKYSFPFLSLAPSLVLFTKEQVLDERLGKCLDTLSTKAFIKVVKAFQKEQRQWTENIVRYREGNLYHFGKASEYLAEYILHNFFKIDFKKEVGISSKV